MAGTRAMYSSCFGDREAPISVVAFDIADGLIVAIDLIMDPAKTRHLDV